MIYFATFVISWNRFTLKTLTNSESLPKGVAHFELWILNFEFWIGYELQACASGGKEPLTSSSNSYEDSRKFVLEIVEYVKKRETEIKKEYNLKKVEKKIIITQNNEKEY